MTTLQAALSELEAVFPATTLTPERAFGEGGTTYLDGEKFIEGARGHTWQSLDAEFLEQHHDGMIFLAPEEFGRYIPAFVVAVARGGSAIRNLPTFLRAALTRTRDPQWFDARISRLSGAQQRAIANVLMALEEGAENRLDKKDLTEVVDSYWRYVAKEGNS